MVEGTYTTFKLSSLLPCTPTGNAEGTTWRAHPKPLPEEDGSWFITVPSEYRSDFFKLYSSTSYTVLRSTSRLYSFPKYIFI